MLVLGFRYSTAYAESEYTEPDEDEPEPEPESEEDEEERSCATVLTLRQEDSQEEEERKVEEEEEEEEEGRLWMEAEVPHGELALLLAQSDILHTGDATLKADGFQLLLDNRAEVSCCLSTMDKIRPQSGQELQLTESGPSVCLRFWEIDG